MAAWTQYTQDEYVYRALVEIGDYPSPSYRWASDAELRGYVDEFNDIIQQDLELVWGSATMAVGAGTGSFVETALATNIMRLDRCYWNSGTSTATYLLAPRDQEDLYLAQQGWETAGTGVEPKVIYRIAAGTWGLWPTPPVAGTLTAEYPLRVRFATTTSTSPLPAWTREWPQAYCAYRVYSRFSPIQDLPRASVYRRLHEHNLQTARKILDGFLPAAQAGVLRPGRGLNARVLGGPNG